MVTTADVKKECPLCRWKDIQAWSISRADVFRVECPRCGEYLITEECLIYKDVKAELDKVSFMLSGLSRETQETESEPFTITTKNFKELASQYPAPKADDPEAKAEKFIERLKQRSLYYGHMIELDYEKDLSLAYAKNSDEFRAIVKFVIDAGLITTMGQSNMGVMAILTNGGWGLGKRLEQK
jgi:hypothetical protein